MKELVIQVVFDFFLMPLDWIEEEKSAKLYNKLDKVGLVDNRPSAN